MTLRIDPTLARLLAQTIVNAAEVCSADEHVRVEQTSRGTFVGVSNGLLVRAERVVKPYTDRAGGYVQ